MYMPINMQLKVKSEIQININHISIVIIYITYRILKKAIPMDSFLYAISNLPCLS